MGMDIWNCSICGSNFVNDNGGMASCCENCGSWFCDDECKEKADYWENDETRECGCNNCKTDYMNKLSTEKIYLHRDKEDNWDIEADLIENNGVPEKVANQVLYLGYEVGMEIDIYEDDGKLKFRVKSIQGIDISDKDIYI